MDRSAPLHLRVRSWNSTCPSLSGSGTSGWEVFNAHLSQVANLKVVRPVVFLTWRAWYSHASIGRQKLFFPRRWPCARLPPNARLRGIQRLNARSWPWGLWCDLSSQSRLRCFACWEPREDKSRLTIRALAKMCDLPPSPRPPPPPPKYRCQHLVVRPSQWRPGTVSRLLWTKLLLPRRRPLPQRHSFQTSRSESATWWIFPSSMLRT